MANRRIETMDIGEMVRLLRAGESDATISAVIGHHRRTVARYRAWAQEQGLLDGEVPATGDLHQRLTRTLPRKLPPQQVSGLAAYTKEVQTYRELGVEMAAIRARLEEAHGHPVSYSAVRRLVAHLEPGVVDAVVRVEVKPGSEAQVDFGYAGLSVDPATGLPRKTWLFTMVLSWSRHQYAELVWDQRIETWLLCHRHAFEFFGAVPARVVPDNLKAAIVKASFTEPVAQRSYRECAAHYDFMIDPQPPRAPWLKGKVEKGGVHYVKRNFLAGRPRQDRDQLNAALLAWCTQTAGQRLHGTTKCRPLERFRTVEQAALRPLPPTPYDVGVWKQATLYRDCYLAFESAYYSAPYRLVGQQLWVRGGTRTVEIYTTEHHLVATHDRATQPGERHTLLDHLPPEKVGGLTLTREHCRMQAQTIGPATTAIVDSLLAHRPEDRLRAAGRLVRLAETTAPERVERACARAQAYGAADYATVKRILREGLDQQALPPRLTVVAPPPAAHAEAPSPLRPYTFVRQASEFVSALFGGVR
jgi:transposase